MFAERSLLKSVESISRLFARHCALQLTPPHSAVMTSARHGLRSPRIAAGPSHLSSRSLSVPSGPQVPLEGRHLLEEWLQYGGILAFRSRFCPLLVPELALELDSALAGRNLLKSVTRIRCLWVDTALCSWLASVLSVSACGRRPPWPPQHRDPQHARRTARGHGKRAAK